MEIKIYLLYFTFLEFIKFKIIKIYSNPKNYHLRPTAENHPMQSEGKTLENEVLIESGSKSEVLVFSICKT
ncbi:MAG: hypothetical protein PUH54_00440, partial [Oscillospiraceae bacterium]|nr:hypothetical protein [Oscillospiraceae bacterium]